MEEFGGGAGPSGKSTHPNPSKLRKSDMPAATPIIVPHRYGKGLLKNDLGYTGLAVVNDGEPAYDITISNVLLEDGNRIEFQSGHTDRLAKSDGESFYPCFIAAKLGGTFGSGLFDFMRERGIGAIEVSITYRDSSHRWFQTDITLRRDVEKPGGLRLVSHQKRISNPKDPDDAPIYALENGGTHSVAGKKNKPVDRWLSLVALAVGVALYLLPKTEPVIIGCCILIWISLLPLFIRFWWVEDRKWRQVLAGSILTAGIVLLDLNVGPERPQERQAERNETQTIPSPAKSEQSESTPPKPGRPLQFQTELPKTPLVTLMFKDSPLFTPERRQRITKDINGFAEDLKDLGIPIPADIPPIGVDTTDPKGPEWSFNEQGNSKYYYNQFTLKQGVLDNRQKVTEAFCYFVIGRFIYKASPLLPFQLTPEQWEDAIHTPEQMDQSYRHAVSGTLTQYLNHSYWNRDLAENEKPVCPDQGDGMTYYFWRIREEYGKKFTDTLAVFTIRATVDKPYADANQRFRQYFYERLRMADSVIDNENSKMPAIDAILRDCDWLPK